MKSLLKAVFEKEVASVTLARKWSVVDGGEDPWRAVLQRNVSMCCFFLFSISFTFLFFTFEPLSRFAAGFLFLIFLALFVVVSGAGFLITGIVYVWQVPDQRFLRGCYRLSKHISLAGRLSEAELSERAEQALVRAAGQLIRYERKNGRGSSSADAARADFRAMRRDTDDDGLR